MGYTHSWRRPRALDFAAFMAASADCAKVAELAAARGIELAGWDGSGEPTFEPAIVAFNGLGEASHETFAVPCVSDAREHEGMEPEGMVFEFCKTNRKPYDAAVTACLLVLKHHLGDAILVTSNGGIGEWQAGIELAAEAGVKGAWDFVPSGADLGATLERAA